MMCLFLHKQQDKPTTLLAVFAVYMWVVFMLIVAMVVMFSRHDPRQRYNLISSRHYNSTKSNHQPPPRSKTVNEYYWEENW